MADEGVASRYQVLEELGRKDFAFTSFALSAGSLLT